MLNAEIKLVGVPAAANPDFRPQIVSEWEWSVRGGGGGAITANLGLTKTTPACVPTALGRVN